MKFTILTLALLVTQASCAKEGDYSVVRDRLYAFSTSPNLVSGHPQFRVQTTSNEVFNYCNDITPIHQVDRFKRVSDAAMKLNMLLNFIVQEVSGRACLIDIQLASVR